MEKLRTKNSNRARWLLLSALALIGACSLQGGLTDLGEHAVMGASGDSNQGDDEDQEGGSDGGSSASGGSRTTPAPGGQQGSGAKSGAGGAGEPAGGGGRGADPDPSVGFASMKNEFGFAFEDSFFLTACREVQGHDCLTIPSDSVCPNQALPIFEQRGDVFVESFMMGGDAGKMYEVTLSVNGIVEGKYYDGVELIRSPGQVAKHYALSDFGSQASKVVGVS